MKEELEQGEAPSQPSMLQQEEKNCCNKETLRAESHNKKS